MWYIGYELMNGVEEEFTEEQLAVQAEFSQDNNTKEKKEKKKKKKSDKQEQVHAKPDVQNGDDLVEKPSKGKKKGQHKDENSKADSKSKSKLEKEVETPMPEEDVKPKKVKQTKEAGQKNASKEEDRKSEYP